MKLRGKIVDDTQHETVQPTPLLHNGTMNMVVGCLLITAPKHTPFMLGVSQGLGATGVINSLSRMGIVTGFHLVSCSYFSYVMYQEQDTFQDETHDTQPLTTAFMLAVLPLVVLVVDTIRLS